MIIIVYCVWVRDQNFECNLGLFLLHDRSKKITPERTVYQNKDLLCDIFLRDHGCVLPSGGMKGMDLYVPVIIFIITNMQKMNHNTVLMTGYQGCLVVL